MASERRKRTQKGQEIIEFSVMMVCIFVPLFMGSFVVGMNLIRSIECNQVCRDLANIYIHGGDFSTYSIQEEAQRLAQGLHLDIGSSFTGNEQANTSNSGNGIVTVSQIMWIGGATSSSCVSVGVSNCTNQNSFVFTQQIQFGNGTLANSNTVTLGSPTGASINSSGIVSNYITDSHAALSGTAQTAMKNLWAANNGTGQTALADGQVVYIVETYFQSPDLSVGALAGNGVYARYFM
jgi:hypothetical protein